MEGYPQAFNHWEIGIMFTAFDYDTQRWVTGNDAVEILRSQLSEELDTLTGEGGARYLAFVGTPSARLDEMIATCRAQLAALPPRGWACI